MKIIVFEEDAYYKMLREVHDIVHDAISKANKEATSQGKATDNWLTTVEAMKELKIKSKNKLIRLRREGSLKFSRVGGNYRYSLKSIENYLTKSTF
jgi:hypothetical protein